MWPALFGVLLRGNLEGAKLEPSRLVVEPRNGGAVVVGYHSRRTGG